MCNIPVTLPTLASFLMLYSLRCGCFVVWAWTLLRSIFYLTFFLLIVLRMYMPDPEPEWIKSRPHDDYFFCVFICFVIMIVTECFVIMFAIYLSVGLYYDSAYRVEQYLIGRFCALLLELSTLVVLIFHHHYFMGWYLIFLMIIILEFYSFIVVYSYYVDIIEEQKAKECASICDPRMSAYDGCNYECPSELQEPCSQGIQGMRPSRHSRTSRHARPPPPAPRDSPEPRNMPDNQERMSYHSRAMRLVQEKLHKLDNKSDFRVQQCTRNMQDPKPCMCTGYRTPY
ncbi:hypothetical protein PYW08_011571 [Mythimna loreyi]|uniref:Uncharacterized protein n=1 Tax=Mythimna loreyi TaxID=667449 RepID=A0ACC2QKB5_9NEOP|nr:hypothetical protein PYW08_011571 [Mythimna loreyi]